MAAEHGNLCSDWEFGTEWTLWNLFEYIKMNWFLKIFMVSSLKNDWGKLKKKN